MRIAIGSDHAGFDQKQHLARYLANQGHEVTDVGTSSSEDSVDYPDFAQAVGRAVADGEADVGILLCGTGIGMAIAANKIAGVRAANVTSAQFARLAREHNHANVVTLSARFVPIETNNEIVDTFLETQFADGRHATRVAKIGVAEG
jgi:ribose 5-phosphate isomerase B